MLFLLLLACKTPTEPRTLVETVGTEADSAVVWNGFAQAWGYNHRMNSLGDYVAPLTCDETGCAADVVHVAASGSGSDEAAWRSLYTTVHAPGVTFLGGTTLVALDLDDAEGERITFDADVIVPGAFAEGATHAFLNGFDLLATDDADKLQHLTLLVGEPEAGDADVRIPVDIELQLDCDSVECDGTFQLDASLHYEVLVSWLLMTSDDVAVTTFSASQAYRWSNTSLEDEIDVRSLTESGVATGEPGFDDGFLAVTGLSVDLDDDYHMAEWSTAVSPGRYDANTGELPFDATLAFKQWNAGTWWNPVSYTEPGSAGLQVDLALVQLPDACVRTGDQSGAIVWNATGGPATEAAVDRRTVRPVGCQ